MAVGIILFESNNSESSVRWAARIAESQHAELVIFEVKRRISSEPPGQIDIKNVPKNLSVVVAELMESRFEFTQIAAEESSNEVAQDKDPNRLPLSIMHIKGEDLVDQMRRQIESRPLKLVVLPRNPTIRSNSNDFAVQRQILSELPCEIVQLAVGNGDGRKCNSILVPTGEGAHSRLAVRRAFEIAEVDDAAVKLLFVEPAFDDVAEQVGKKILEHLLQSIELKNEKTERTVVLADSVQKGVHSAISKYTDLVVLGKQHHGAVYRFLFRSISESLIQSNPGPAIVVIQPPVPLTGRVVRAANRFLQSNVPQIEREKRVQLVEKIQSSSNWNFDFIALICLSTLIASGGLLQNSSAVVIGAMLVAPLMTPLLGTGLSLVQGNSILFRNTVMTVVRGFLLAYALGCVLGAVVGFWSANHVTGEMAARGSPGVLDLVVALISGIAAAYAVGRPNLLSALPGVAIAASLIPPVATSGIATVMGEFQLAGGAAILFLTNIVAIILGTSLSFWAIGIRGSHGHSQFNRWAISAGIVLLGIAIGLAFYESIPAESIPSQLQTEVNHMLKSQDAVCEHIHWMRLPSGERGIDVMLVSTKVLSNRAVNAVNDLIGNEFEKPPKVRIQTKIQASFD